MVRFWKTAAAVSGLLVLAGCGDRPPGYTDLFSKQFMYFPAERAISEARNARPSGNTYPAAFHKYAMEHANYEFTAMQDYRDAQRHAEWATAAGRGGNVTVTELGMWQLPRDKVDELSSARSRLVTALNGGGATRNPDSAGKAVARFNCWVEQQEENFQPRDIKYCRDQFFAALADIESRTGVAAPAAPEVVTIQSDVLFDFDRATIKPEFYPALDRIASMLVQNTNMRAQISGHADRAGSAPYNQRLSERRARNVADYMVRKGVSRDRLTVQGFGESQPAVPTADGVREPRNRRVELRQR